MCPILGLVLRWLEAMHVKNISRLTFAVAVGDMLQPLSGRAGPNGEGAKDGEARRPNGEGRGDNRQGGRGVGGMRGDSSPLDSGMGRAAGRGRGAFTHFLRKHGVRFFFARKRVNIDQQLSPPFRPGKT